MSRVHSSYAIITTRDRPEWLRRGVAAIERQIDRVLIVDHLSDPAVNEDDFGDNVSVLRRSDEPPNISALWNAGLDLVKTWAELDKSEMWDVTVLNDDAAVPEDWQHRVSNRMRFANAAAACVDPHRRLHAPLLKTKADTDLMTRLVGFAFMVRGELGMRFDTNLVWWWGDTDFDWRARRAGGIVIVPGEPPEHSDPNGYTNRVPSLTEQAGRDRETFIRKWGDAPW